ncbi:unnamed protein product [Chondrus crispus]|uniref:B box-type domain-containing protein n=1 Tax=Chondrus crispus TaxID=2769 RepID=R7QFN9_CHOCR|nr:unnamed protein product [Chondrus crispus]CDF36563.1 unnamed protein product [Chondrus crispus]|eukprot:XP_005716382.1 unnamed protein product [Chondrus crispus]
MTRLFGVRAVCDGCLSAAATVFCVNHRTVVCFSCDDEQHASPHTASHQRVDLSSAVTALPFCERCDDAPAIVYCESEGITFCDKCDCVSHASQTSPPHCRTPISSTLRHRPVEFRGLPDNRTSSVYQVSSSPSFPASTRTKLSHLDSTKNGNDGRARRRAFMCAHVRRSSATARARSQTARADACACTSYSYAGKWRMRASSGDRAPRCTSPASRCTLLTDAPYKVDGSRPSFVTPVHIAPFRTTAALMTGAQMARWRGCRDRTAAEGGFGGGPRW